MHSDLTGESNPASQARGLPEEAGTARRTLEGAGRGPDGLRKPGAGLTAAGSTGPLSWRGYNSV